MGDGGNESVAVTAGIWGFLVLFGLAIACWLLFRSMNNHLRKLKWQEEQDHPVRQRIPSAPPRAAGRATTPTGMPTGAPKDPVAENPDSPPEKD